MIGGSSGGNLRALWIVVGLIKMVRWLCYLSVIVVPEVTHIHLSCLLPFISLRCVIPLMKMIMQSISNKPSPSPELTMLKNIQILLKFMLDDCLPHDLVVQL